MCDVWKSVVSSPLSILPTGHAINGGIRWLIMCETHGHTYAHRNVRAMGLPVRAMVEVIDDGFAIGFAIVT